ncbi:MAG: serine hydrolase domain-containing protein [Nitrospiraceae bacterium]
MLRRSFWVLLSTILCATGCSSNSDSAPPPSTSAPIASTTCTKAADTLQTQLDTDRSTVGAPAATLGVIGADSCTWDSTSGTRALDDATPPQGTDHLRIGSVTKTFVATLVLMLRDEGRLSLDAPLSTWIAPFPNNTSITIRHLLSHTSGVPEYITTPAFIAGGAKVWTPDELIALVATAPAQFPPGAAFVYTNTNYVLLGLIVERVTGTSISEQIRTRILTPLNLRETYFAGQETGPATIRGFGLIGGVLTDVTDLIHPSRAYAAGALVSTVRDLRRFTAALFGGQLLSEASLREMTAPVALSDRTLAPYGLGIGIRTDDAGTVWYHDGNIAGFSAAIRYWPTLHIGVVVIVNRGSANLSALAAHARQALHNVQ